MNILQYFELGLGLAWQYPNIKGHPRSYGIVFYWRLLILIPYCSRLIWAIALRIVGGKNNLAVLEEGRVSLDGGKKYRMSKSCLVVSCVQGIWEFQFTHKPPLNVEFPEL